MRVSGERRRGWWAGMDEADARRIVTRIRRQPGWYAHAQSLNVWGTRYVVVAYHPQHGKHLINNAREFAKLLGRIQGKH